jgi:hypothetical protein
MGWGGLLALLRFSVRLLGFEFERYFDCALIVDGV